MDKNWFWIGKYLIVIVAALILGAVLGSLGLFKSATLGTPKLTAGALAQFIAHGGALVLLWLLGQRLAGQFRETGGSVANLAASVLALITLIVAASAYVVLLRFITPLT
jgi:serine/threonine-protein kinase